MAGRVGVAMVISWGGHSPSLTLTEKIMLPACLSTDVATNRHDIRSSGNKANVHACTKVYETDPVFESRDYEATSQPTIPSCLAYSTHRCTHLENYSRIMRKVTCSTFMPKIFFIFSNPNLFFINSISLKDSNVLITFPVELAVLMFLQQHCCVKKPLRYIFSTSSRNN